jgi:uncharacterized protein YfaP (DUF2135 family)
MILLALIALLQAAPPLPADPVPDDAAAIDAPLAGWRAVDPDRAAFVQTVSYPASSVNTDAADPAQLIRGRVASSKKPATLVVNGASLPLLANDDGTFARPWSFAAGSNSIELRGPGARPVRRQFYEAGRGGPPARLRVLLSWDTDATDVDLHVVSPTGEHTFYGDRISPSGGALDVDVTTGFGPEIFAHPSPPLGAYQVYVNYYGAGERPDDEVTVAAVTLLMGEGTPRERRQQFTVPLRNPGEVTLVHSFVYP